MQLQENNNEFNPADAVASYDELCATYGKELVDTELEIEQQSQFAGTLRAMKALNNDKVHTGGSKIFLETAVPILSKAVSDWVTTVNSATTGGRHYTAAKLLPVANADAIAYITLCSILKEFLSPLHYYKGGVPLVGIAHIIAKNVEDELRFQRIFSVLSKSEKRLKEAQLNHRIGVIYKAAYLRSLENSKILLGDLEVWQKWDQSQRLAVGIKLIELAISSLGVGDLVLTHETNKKHANYILVLNDKLLKEIEAKNNLISKCAFIKKPMVIPPKPWTEPFDGGYYINLKRPEPFVKLPNILTKRLYSDVDMPNVYNAVNIIQSTPWKINVKILDIANEISTWQNPPEALDFPSLKPAEPPIRPSDADEDPEVQLKWRHEMLRYYQLDNSRKGKRLSINALISLAEEYKKYSKIYFPCNIDFRGRIYALTVLNPQGSDFCKSLLLFADGKAVGKTGAKWLAFHGANCFGLDKQPLKDRFAWATSNEALIRKIAENPLENLEWTETDSPWEFLAWCFEWVGYLEQGESFVSCIPIAFDGSCSGLQHYSAMLRDPVGGKAVNLVPCDTVQDIYSIVSDIVKQQAENDFKNGTEDTEELKNNKIFIRYGTKHLAKDWLDYGITRKVTKRSVMTLTYGSKQYGFKNQLLEDIIYPYKAKNPNGYFQRPNAAAMYMAKLIWDAVNTVVKKPLEAMTWLQETSGLLAAQEMNGKPIPSTWVTPAGFPVQQAYTKTTRKAVKLLLNKGIMIKDPLNKKEHKNNINEKTQIFLNICKNEPFSLNSRKQRQGIAPNFVHSMDASHLMLTILACKDKGLTSFATIHDSYGTTAADAEVLYHTVREVFAKTYLEHNVLQEIYEQTKSQLPIEARDQLEPPPSQGDLDLTQITNSKYAFS